jgi:hypothetical protein
MTEAPIPTLNDRRETQNLRRNLWIATVVAVVVGCSFQLLWFARTCFHEIDFDGMAYLGIARHIRQGDFHAAINAFRSPLISWLIAAVPFGHGDYLHIGKLVNVGSFVLSLGVLYVLAESLWRSRLAAATATLLLVLGRGLAASAVEIVTPDFLFAALVLVYFILLLRALRNDRWQTWLLLGGVHGLAFLAKAFALPWLTVCTVATLLLSGKPWRTRFGRFAAAALIPVVIAAGWAAVLHSKYGVFTTGSQFKANLLQWTLHAYRDHPDPTYAVLRDATQNLDEYIVGDPMPPGSWPWAYRIEISRLLPKVIVAEEHNLPQVAKEMIIVATPGGMLAFAFALIMLTRQRDRNLVEWRFAAVIAVAALSLVLAYSMLVVDARYLYPLTPLILAVSAGFLAGAGELNFRLWRRICLVLVVAGFVFSLTYWASPFRTLTRDFQLSCYDAANHLRAHAGSRVVSLGAGPFPEHGVGWEAGFKAAYFGGRRIVGTMDSLPDPTQLSSLMADTEKASPDAILVWGRPNDAKRANLLQHLVQVYPHNSTEKILDPRLGEVGVVIFPRARAAQGNLVATVN